MFVGPWIRVFASPPPPPPPPAPGQGSNGQSSAADDFVAGAAERRAARWRDSLSEVRTRTLSDLDPVVLAAARAQMKEVGPASKAFQGTARMLAAEGMASLDRPMQLEMLKAIRQRPEDPQHHTLLRRLLAYPSFLRLDPAAQRATLESFGKLTNAQLERFFVALRRTDDAGKDRLFKLIASEDFRALDSKSQDRWLHGLCHADPAIRQRTHERLEETWAGPFYEHGDRAGKVDMMHRAATALMRPYGAPETRDPLPGASLDPPAITKDLRTKEASVFIGDKKLKAERYRVEIEGQTIEVFVPKKIDPAAGKVPTVDEIAASLAGLPKALRSKISQVIIQPTALDPARPEASPFMLAGQKDGKHPDRIFIFPQPDGLPDRPAMTATLSHEAGHLVAGNAWVADRKRAEAWKQAIYSDDFAPSFYAARSLQEDVAETIQLYYQVKGTAGEAQMKRQMPARYALVKELLGE